MDTIAIKAVIKAASDDLCRRIDQAQQAADVKVQSINVVVRRQKESKDGKISDERTVACASAKMVMILHAWADDRHLI